MSSTWFEILSAAPHGFCGLVHISDEVFPSLGCRFVSVLDCLDSEGDNTDMLHFLSLMNDYHLRDMSNKIKSVMYGKRASGQYIATYAPYGYKKSVEDRHKLVIDEYAADIVRWIYKQRLSGKAYGKITAALNQNGILSPGAYRKEIAGKDDARSKSLWLECTVKLILSNEVYTGTIVSNRTTTRSYKDRTRIVNPASAWIRHEAAHDAIIPLDDWKAVQEINEASKSRVGCTHKPVEKLFSSKLICADCKTFMIAYADTCRRNKDSEKHYVSYRCGRFLKSGRSVCSLHTIYERPLSEIVLSEIKKHARAVVLDEVAVVNRLKHEIAGYDEEHLISVKAEIRELRRRVQKLEDTIAKLYEDKYSGTISESTFAMLIRKNEEERLVKAERLDMLLSEVHETEKKTDAIYNWTAIIRKYLNIQELTRTVVDELIDHIEVGERTIVDGIRSQDIKIFYRFVGLIK